MEIERKRKNLSNRNDLKRIKRKNLVKLAEVMLSEKVFNNRELESHKYTCERLNEENIKSNTLCRNLSNQIRTLKEVVRMYKRDLMLTKEFLWPRKVKRPISIQLKPSNLETDEVEKNIKILNLRIIYPSQHVLNSLSTHRPIYKNGTSHDDVALLSINSQNKDEICNLQNSHLGIEIENDNNNNFPQTSSITFEKNDYLQLSNPPVNNFLGTVDGTCEVIKSTKSENISSQQSNLALLGRIDEKRIIKIEKQSCSYPDINNTNRIEDGTCDVVKSIISENVSSQQSNLALQTQSRIDEERIIKIENQSHSHPDIYNSNQPPCSNVINNKCNQLKEDEIKDLLPQLQKESFQSKLDLTHPPPLHNIYGVSNAVSGYNSLPSQPKIKAKSSKDGQNIIVSWDLASSQDKDEVISFYELFGYKESNSINGYKWRQIGGNIDAVPLPMAVTLSQFKHGFNYHFCVCAVNSLGHRSEFSIPQCLKF